MHELWPLHELAPLHELCPLQELWPLHELTPLHELIPLHELRPKALTRATEPDAAKLGVAINIAATVFARAVPRTVPFSMLTSCLPPCPASRAERSPSTVFQVAFAFQGREARILAGRLTVHTRRENAMSVAMAMFQTASKAVVFGLSGLSLTARERAFFSEADPFGFILFARNCDTPDQVRDLTSELREAAGREDVAILIDQEGGRVSRLRPPNWPEFAAARTFGEAYERNPEQALARVRENGLRIGEVLASVGITVNCAPCCDLFLPQTTRAIGDRAYSASPAATAALAMAFAQGQRDAGVLPMIKHLPGHGRATTDSHEQLPIVDTPRAELERTDFAAFRPLADLPLAMTAHVVYTAIHPALPATLSPTVIREAIRGDIGFRGFLFSDDLVMKALSGDRTALALQALHAGVDCVLHCSGDMTEMTKLAETLPTLSEQAMRSWRSAKDWLAGGKGSARREKADAPGASEPS